MRKYLSNVHKMGGAHLQYVNNHYAKLEKRNESFWSYKLHKLGTPKVLQTDKRTNRRTEWTHY